MLEDKDKTMKKLYTLAVSSTIVIALSGCASGLSTPSKAKSVMDIDTKTACSIEKNGLENVLALAKKYNPIAVKHKVEFMRFGVSTTKYIKGVDTALKTNSKTVSVIGKKKKVQKFDINYATERACRFAISALKQEKEAQSTWRLAVPGDGFKY